MSEIINAKTLRQELGQIVARVRKGEDFTVLYRSRPAFRIVPVDASRLELGNLEDDPLYEAKAVGESSDGLTAAEHDGVLYPRPSS